jgi:hypothetical protein
MLTSYTQSPRDLLRYLRSLVDAADRAVSEIESKILKDKMTWSRHAETGKGTEAPYRHGELQYHLRWSGVEILGTLTVGKLAENMLSICPMKPGDVLDGPADWADPAQWPEAHRDWLIKCMSEALRRLDRHVNPASRSTGVLSNFEEDYELNFHRELWARATTDVQLLVLNARKVDELRQRALYAEKKAEERRLQAEREREELQRKRQRRAERRASRAAASA